MRPTIHIDHPATLTAQARRGEGPTAGLYCGMAGRHRHGCVATIGALAPAYSDMKAVRAGDITVERYADLCLSRWRALDLAPGGEHVGSLSDGAGLFCECARPGSKARRHPCHRELWPLVLVPAGWDVVLYGRRITLHRHREPVCCGRPVRGWDGEPECCGYPDEDERWSLAYADDGTTFDPAAYGWPRLRLE